jgi:hypothetical protein
MPVSHPIAEFDIVELTKAVDDAPAGARGGVLETFSDGKAMVEITSLPGELDVDRIIIVPFAKLRVVDAHSRP